MYTCMYIYIYTYIHIYIYRDRDVYHYAQLYTYDVESSASPAELRGLGFPCHRQKMQPPPPVRTPRGAVAHGAVARHEETPTVHHEKWALNRTKPRKIVIYRDL